MPDDPEEPSAQVEHWRTAALETWSQGVESTRHSDVLERRLNQTRDRVIDLQDKVRALRRRAEEAEERLREIEASTSWRVTGPLRRASGAARRLRRVPPA